MSWTVKMVSSPELLSDDWDKLATCCYMKKPFLSHLHHYNFCNQRYYELFEVDRLIYGTIVYTLNVNMFTFSKLKCMLKMQVIGIPVSIAAPPFVGDEQYADYLLGYILKNEKGLILGINFLTDHCKNKVLNMRTLPTIVMKNPFSSMDEYKNAVRYPYRRRLVKHGLRFKDVNSQLSGCHEFTQMHYTLYLEIMKRSKTKLEILDFDFFHNLTKNFVLTTHYIQDKMLAWQICTLDQDQLYFLFGGLDYHCRDIYSAYYNNLLSILKFAIEHKFSVIDFGQTAELAKLRLGGELNERRMFLYHRYFLINFLLKLLKDWISYSVHHNRPDVFKHNVI